MRVLTAMVGQVGQSNLLCNTLAYHEGVDSYGLKDAGGAEQPPL
jgi:hypothetical protein